MSSLVASTIGLSQWLDSQREDALAGKTAGVRQERSDKGTARVPYGPRHPQQRSRWNAHYVQQGSDHEPELQQGQRMDHVQQDQLEQQLEQQDKNGLNELMIAEPVLQQRQ